MREIVVRDIDANVKAAKRLVERGDERICERVKNAVLLNRAPTLHHLQVSSLQSQCD